jgi:hypothetical protein
MLCAERIQEVLTLLRGGNLSPFNVVLEVLDESNSKYSAYWKEIYKEGNSKLLAVLNHVLALEAGKWTFRSIPQAFPWTGWHISMQYPNPHLR